MEKFNQMNTFTLFRQLLKYNILVKEIEEISFISLLLKCIEFLFTFTVNHKFYLLHIQRKFIQPEQTV